MNVYSSEFKPIMSADKISTLVASVFPVWTAAHILSIPAVAAVVKDLLSFAILSLRYKYCNHFYAKPTNEVHID